MVIAIDGPGGVGKSTVARGVAAAIGASYLNTGAYYRAATIAALDAGADPADPVAVIDAVEQAVFAFVGETMLLDGRDVSERSRSPEVTNRVSIVSAIPSVRALMVRYQRQWVADHDGHAVVEGRDIGTVVFPDAAVKVFLTASEEERARRRSGDREAEGQNVDSIAEALRRRDHIDSTRETSPLTAAEDAVTIDTTAYEADDVIDIVLGLIDPI
ncbi:MAG: (d)CMP kinase [Acidimicrobiia bacterium]|nr:(d)CMP kinase [Acidimicrobiia bacterium]